jgi:hypothetical protein
MIELTSKQDIDMEILCTLSTRPASAKTLCNDFGFELIKDLRKHISNISHFGIRMGYPNRNENTEVAKGVYVWISQDYWSLARATAEEYWDRTHSDEG